MSGFLKHLSNPIVFRMTRLALFMLGLAAFMLFQQTSVIFAHTGDPGEGSCHGRC